MAARVTICNVVRLRSLFVISLFLRLVACLYEDQVGKFDWRQQFIGKALFANFDNSIQGSRRIVLVTEENVLASLYVNSGDIAWRYVFERDQVGKVDAFLQSGNDFITVSGGGRLLRKWNVASGSLSWEVMVPISDVADRSARTGSAQVRIDQSNIAVLTEKSLHLHSKEKGEHKWSLNLPHIEKCVYTKLHQSEKKIFAICTSNNSHIAVITVDSKRGIIQSNVVVPAAWIKADSSCIVSNSGFLVCGDLRSSSLHALKLDGGTTFSTLLLSSIGLQQYSQLKLTCLDDGIDVASTTVRIAVQSKPTHFTIIEIQNGAKLALIKDLPEASSVGISAVDQKPILITTTQKGSETIGVWGYALSETNVPVIFQNTIKIGLEHGQVERIFLHTYVNKKGNSPLGYRILALTEDNALMLLQSGEVQWVREEALASIISVELLDLPVSENQAKFEEEFGSQQDNLLSMFVNRFHTQLLQLRSYITDLVTDVIEGLKHVQHTHSLVRDDFGLNKIAVALTKPGKIFGIYSSSGKIVWSHLVKNLRPFQQSGGKPILPLFVQRTTAHFPKPPQCIVLGRSKTSGKGMVYTFEPITGQTVIDAEELEFEVLQAMFMHHHDDDFMRGMLLVDRNRKLHVYPKHMKSLVQDLIPSLYMFVCEADKGALTGYRVNESKDKDLIVEEIWNVQIPQENQHITSIIPRSSNEHVHSQGRVLGDRSVLYKYLNPNLLVIITEGKDNSVQQKGQNGIIGVYLVDAITGLMVFSAKHSRCKGPIHVVHCENWVVYSYWNEKARRTEMAVLELYEGTVQHNATTFSSLDPPKPPIVLRQSYIFPAHVSAMAASSTEKGITHKTILVASPPGGIVEIPKLLLDPRRPNIMTNEHREEGLIPYIPELNMPLENTINYNQSVLAIRGIHCAPGGLESTSLVLAYGLDMFYTRVTPSKTFDVLKDDFDYWLIAVVVSALVIASVVAQKLASRKSLTQAWK